MKKNDIGLIDRQVINLLTEDGLIPVKDVAKILGVTGPTVRSRMRKLIQSKILKVAGLIDPSKIENFNVAITVVNLTNHQKLDEKLGIIGNLPNVHWAAVVTGTYDIIFEVVLSKGMSDLYTFLTRDLAKVGGIRSHETFMVLKGKNKWVSMPKVLKY